jgi:N-acetylglucosamine malate deacetylase 1
MDPITRREMLGRSGLLGTTVAIGLPVISAAAEDIVKSKYKVVVTGGHPGDPEYGCGGTIALFSDLGHDVVILYLNKGEWTDKPSYDPAPVRVGEATRACEILKARPAFAGQIDAKSIVDQAHYDEFHRLIAAEKPDAVFTQWPIDNHPDHRAVSLLTYEAWKRMGKKFALYYYEVSNGEDTVQFAPSHYVDISATAPRKREACYAHASQAPDKFYSLQEMVMRMRGIESGHKYAEAFIHLVQSPAFVLPSA